jgi:hypothetical protein
MVSARQNTMAKAITPRITTTKAAALPGVVSGETKRLDMPPVQRPTRLPAARPAT